MEELEKLIDFIQLEYTIFSESWKNSKYYTKANLKNTLVKDIVKNNYLLDVVFNYREFINQNNIQLLMDFKEFSTSSETVNIRTKTKNSIEYKIKRYTEKDEGGEIPINKCLNDLFGIRLISNKLLEYKDILKLVKEKSENLKCIDSSKKDYVATHIYFKKDNYSFQWELQIWNKINEMDNIVSHEKYKQDYVRWEKESKGGI